MRNNKKALSPEQRKELLGALKARFEKNLNRNQGLGWPRVQAKLEANAENLSSLHEMERTGGEPDVERRSEIRVIQYVEKLCTKLKVETVGDALATRIRKTPSTEWDAAAWVAKADTAMPSGTRAGSATAARLRTCSGGGPYSPAEPQNEYRPGYRTLRLETETARKPGSSGLSQKLPQNISFWAGPGCLNQPRQHKHLQVR
jgi:hypothetical protein